MKNYSSMQWLQINIANHYGLDKETYETRLEWVETHEPTLEDLNQQAKEPELYYKAVNAYRKAQKGEPIGTPVLLDACSSGFQILSAISGCRKGCEATGLIDTGERPNAYMAIKRRMEEILEDEVEISYKDIKQASMTASYGSKAVPEKVFPNEELLKAFQQACIDVMPNAFKLLNVLKNSWQAFALKHSWVMPDNHYVNIPVLQKEIVEITIPELDNWKMNTLVTKNSGQKYGVSNIANIVHSIDAYVLRSVIRYCSYDEDEVNHLLTRVSDELAKRDDDDEIKYVDITYAKSNLEILDTGELIGLYIDLTHMLTHKSFPVMIVHDSFGVHPNNVNRLRYWYNEIMARLSQSNILDNILTQIYKEPVHVDIDREESLYEEIINSNYSIC